MPNVKQTKDGLVEKSTGRKIESPLDMPEVITVAIKLLKNAKRFSDNKWHTLHVLNLAASMALAEIKTSATKSLSSD